MGTWDCVTGGTSDVGTGVRIAGTISAIIHLYYISNGQFSYQAALRSSYHAHKVGTCPQSYSIWECDKMRMVNLTMFWYCEGIVYLIFNRLISVICD